MKILALVGRDGCGKSATIRQWIAEVTKAGAGGSFVCQSDQNRFARAVAEEEDVALPLVYNGHLLAVTTRGDGPAALKPFFEQYGAFAELLICASHEKGTATCRYLEEFREQNHTVEFLYKRIAEDKSLYDEVNAQDVACLQCKINELLKQEEC